jgi:hypothetical protein
LGKLFRSNVRKIRGEQVMNAYEKHADAMQFADDLQQGEELDAEEQMRGAKIIWKLLNRIAELEKQYDAMVMSFEARLATRGYEIQIKDQTDRISVLEKQVDELLDYKISYENLDSGKN